MSLKDTLSCIALHGLAETYSVLILAFDQAETDLVSILLFDYVTTSNG